MKKIFKKFKTKEDFDKFCEILVIRINENKPISYNSMLDGLVIGFILTSSYAKDYFLQRFQEIPDKGMQEIEQINIWIANNKKAVLEILKQI